METVTVREAKANLARLINRVAKGDVFVITKAGKPVAKIVPLTSPKVGKVSRLGFLKGQLRVPEDFDRIEVTIDSPQPITP